MENKKSNSGMVLMVVPKTTTDLVYVYGGLETLEGLTKFVGKTPQINADLTLNFKKQVVRPNSVIFRNSFGDVINVMPLDKFSDAYEVKKEMTFAPEHINKVVEKERKERKSKK